MSSMLFYLLFFFLHFSLLHALSPTRSYEHGPVPFDNIASLYYNLSRSDSTISFALVIKDPKIVSNSTSSKPNWLGLGVSEPTSGSMLGADIVTATFGSDDSCTFTDRHVPFVPFPLGEPGPGGTAFPNADDCQDDGSWTYIGCKREGDSMLLEVERKLDAHDDQDRSIREKDGPGAMIYAYGNDFGYHQGRRGDLQVDLFKETKGSEAELELPDDVDGSFDIFATNYTVPATRDTVYACTSKLVDLGDSDKRTIVAAEALIQADVDMVHHLVLYMCSGKNYADKIKNTVECTTSDNGISGPAGSSEANCSTLVYGYAKGTSRIVLPREAGFPVTSSRQYLVMESHYDNPNLIAGNVDTSGVRLYYTNKDRKFEAASMALADSLVSRNDKKILSGFEYEHTCPSECTSKFSGPVTVFGSFLHMHTTGEEIYTNKFAENGTFIEKVSGINFWNDRFQKFRILSQKKIRPGEQLATTCKYDTSKRPDTKFGLRTINEMCVHFLLYYPSQRDPDNGQEINVCGFILTRDGNFTMCGDNGRGGNITFLEVPNPKFNDTNGAPSTFGDPVETCEAEILPDDIVSPEESMSSVTPEKELNDTSGPEMSNEPMSSVTPENEAEVVEPACFPADAEVQVREGGTKRMEDVTIGDEVAVGNGKYSEVYMLTHADQTRWSLFVRLEVSGRILHATRGHYVYVNGMLKKAMQVKVGDWMMLENGEKGLVEHTGIEWKRGIFNPQTNSGDIVVDGILVSTFTHTVPAAIAQGLLAPLRWAYWICGLDMSWLFF